jgi:CBS domain containing-hemolysin-like protein
VAAATQAGHAAADAASSAAGHAAAGAAHMTGTQLATQLGIVFFLVLLNGFFVASEFSLVAVRRTRIDQLAAEGNASALIVQRAVRELDRYIAATQVGITVASLLLGGIGEKVFHALFEPALMFLPEVGRGLTRSTVAIGLAYFVMTALHVIVGELMPKSIALTKTEATTLVIGRPMLLFAKLFAPLIWMLNGTGNFLLRRIGIESAGEHASVHSPEELDILFGDSHAAGQINETEREMLHRVVKFSEITAREAMLPRVEMKALPLKMTRGDIGKYLRAAPHTRVPVFHGSLDDVVGMVHLRDLVRFEAEHAEGDPDEVLDLMPIVRETARVPETITIDKLLVKFKEHRQQMAIVIDEHGGTSGIVTMGDLLQQVFGDVQDEFDNEDPDIAELPDGRVRLKGRVLIDEINDRYGLGLQADEVDRMAGLVMAEMGRPAREGDQVEVNGARLLVEAVDGLKILSLLLTLPEDHPSNPSNADSEDNVPRSAAVGTADGAIDGTSDGLPRAREGEVLSTR